MMISKTNNSINLKVIQILNLTYKNIRNEKVN
nr:MAG TPA: hypothetical protein [Caudoviricetes sp.]